jgi:imidazolonepropionase
LGFIAVLLSSLFEERPLANRTILVRGARQLLTLHGPPAPRRGNALQQLGIIADGSLLIINGIIEEVGPTRRIENLALARPADEISATGRVVMPGFNDPHVRLVGPPARTLEYPLGVNAAKVTSSELSQAAQQYLKSTPPGRLGFQARRIVERSVRHGTTGIEAKCGYGLDTNAELKALRVSSSIGDGCCSVVPTFIASADSGQFDGRFDAQLDWICGELLPKIRERHLAVFAEVVCEPGGFTVEQARKLLAAARRLGFLLKLQAEQTTRMGAVRLAIDMDARSVSGLNFCDQFDADMLSRSRLIATLLPPSVYHSRSASFPPARMLIDAGVAVALASGYSPSLPTTFSVEPVLSLACTEMEMTPEEAISAATINAAHAMDRAATTGSLENGKEADLVILDVPDYREIPYHLGVNHVELTMRKGEVVYKEGAITCPVQ